MKIIKTKFKDLFLVKGETHVDNRGFFRELVYEKIVPKKIVFTVKALQGILYFTVVSLDLTCLDLTFLEVFFKTMIKRRRQGGRYCANVEV